MWTMVDFDGVSYAWWQLGQKSTRNVWRLTGARQVSYGVDYGSSTGFITVRDAGFDDLVLSVEMGTPAEVVCTVDDDATPEQVFDLLCKLDGTNWTWKQEKERLTLLDDGE